MSQAKNGVVQMEEGSTPQGSTLMEDSGDHQTFGIDGVELFSGDPVAVCRPNGILTGRNLIGEADSGNDDVVDVAACTCNLNGVETAVAAAADLAIARPAGDVAKIVAVIIDSTGVYDTVAGTDGAGAAFSAVVGAAGGPPFIPVDAIKVGEVRLTAAAADVVYAEEIFQNGDLTERSASPTFDVDGTGRGDYAAESAMRRAHVRFSAALPLIHTAGTTKRVYLDYSEPTMAEVSRSSDFTPAEETYSTSASEHYGGVDATESTSLGTASFAAKLNDGVADAVVAAKGTVRIFKFFPDRGKAAHLVTQGRVATARTFAVGDHKKATVTIAATKPTVEFFS